MVFTNCTYTTGLVPLSVKMCYCPQQYQLDLYYNVSGLTLFLQKTLGQDLKKRCGNRKTWVSSSVGRRGDDLFHCLNFHVLVSYSLYYFLHLCLFQSIFIFSPWWQDTDNHKMQSTLIWTNLDSVQCVTSSKYEVQIIAE